MDASIAGHECAGQRMDGLLLGTDVIALSGIDVAVAWVWEHGLVRGCHSGWRFGESAWETDGMQMQLLEDAYARWVGLWGPLLTKSTSLWKLVFVYAFCGCHCTKPFPVSRFFSCSCYGSPNLANIAWQRLGISKWARKGSASAAWVRIPMFSNCSRS